MMGLLRCRILQCTTQGYSRIMMNPMLFFDDGDL